MKRFHVHLHVDDLAKSVGFHSKLFATEPARLEGDSAKWMLEDPPVNFAISTRGSQPGIDHLGIQTDDPAELAAMKVRAEAADMALLDKGEMTCCYARSEKREGLMNQLGAGRLKAWSAGSHPDGTVNPFALQTLATWRIPTDGFRSKSWGEFAQPGAPTLDFAFTVCDNAAGEVCPVWPGQPMTAHWGVPDPAADEGTDAQKAKAFMDTAITLKRRIELMLSLPLNSLAGMSLQREIDQIGKTGA